MLSASTAEYDRGEKLQHYQRIASLEAVVLVDHAGERVDVWLRSEGIWTSSRAGRGERVRLEAVHCELSVDAVLAAAHNA